MKNNQQENTSNSLFKKNEAKVFLLKRMIQENEDRYQKLEADYDRLQKAFSDIEKELTETRQKYRTLQGENESTKVELSLVEKRKAIENYLKNAAYAFLVSEGYTFNYRANLWQRKGEPDKPL